jgi:hypothetical protein
LYSWEEVKEEKKRISDKKKVGRKSFGEGKKIFLHTKKIG